MSVGNERCCQCTVKGLGQTAKVWYNKNEEQRKCGHGKGLKIVWVQNLDRTSLDSIFQGQKYGCKTWSDESLKYRLTMQSNRKSWREQAEGICRTETQPHAGEVSLTRQWPDYRPRQQASWCGCSQGGRKAWSSCHVGSSSWTKHFLLRCHFNHKTWV